ncbi:methyltransferase [Micromonospora sp. LOL_021]|uniref:methyltransferase n=1 Tax=Micromonospora sp. LOL_021 TaxID=3345417 RepID=UPI003A858429
MTEHAPDTTTAAGIIRLGNAFCDAKALLTAVELGLFTKLHAGPATVQELARDLELHGRGLSDLLDLLVALGLLKRDGKQYGNATGAAQYLVRGQESYVGGFLERANRNLYPAWGRLSEALRTGKPQSGSDFTEMISDQGRLRQFVGMMDALTQMIGPQLVAAVDWSSTRDVLDVGGARGKLAAQIVSANSHLSGHVFDLPPMQPLFEQHRADLGLEGRLTFHPGDFFADELPAADAVVLGHVLHDWDPEQRRALTIKAYDAVRPGGMLLVYDRMLTDQPDVENLVISLDMLLVTDGGSEYPITAVYENARTAGFETITHQPLGEYDTLVVCRRAA